MVYKTLTLILETNSLDNLQTTEFNFINVD